jgi:hypothetical protein
MAKKVEIKYTNPITGKEKKEKAYFNLGLSAMNLYEENTGRSISVDIDKLNEGKNTMQVISNLIPAVYAESDGTKLIQNQITFDNAKESAWLDQILFNETLLQEIMDALTTKK